MEKLICCRYGFVVDPVTDKVEPADFSDDVARYEVGQTVRYDYAAPGSGYVEYRVTRVDDEGVWGIELTNTLHILDPWEVI